MESSATSCVLPFSLKVNHGSFIEISCKLYSRSLKEGRQPSESKSFSSPCRRLYEILHLKFPSFVSEITFQFLFLKNEIRLKSVERYQLLIILIVKMISFETSLM